MTSSTEIRHKLLKTNRKNL